MNFLMILSLIIIPTFAIHLKRANYCTSNRQMCKRDLPYTFSDRCPIICKGRLSYKCQHNYCTTDRKACDNLMPVSDLIKTIRIPKEYQKKMRQLNIFISSLSECPWLRYKFNEQDVCSKRISCYLFGCVCKGNHSFKCGENHCPANSLACDVLQSLEKKNQIFKAC